MLGQLAGLFRETNGFAAPDDDGTGTGATEIDFEVQAAVYQAAYSKLAAAGRRGTWSHMREMCVCMSRVRTLVGQADQSQVGPFLLSLGVSV